MKAHLLAIAAVGCGSSADTGVPFQIPVIELPAPRAQIELGEEDFAWVTGRLGRLLVRR